MPTVTIIDTVGVDRKARAPTATVAVKGGVTDITVTVPGAGYLTPGLKKFVDTLPGLGPTAANDLGQYIPVAVPDTTTYPGTDYYEIAVVQYRMKFHRDLPATLLRGYVQLSTTVVPGQADRAEQREPRPGPAGHADRRLHRRGRPALPRADNRRQQGQAGPDPVPQPAAHRRRRRSVPAGRHLADGLRPGPDMMQLDANGVPMDMAADEGTSPTAYATRCAPTTPKPRTCYSENRATLHLHGGITPWISDGTPHQWITPAGEDTAYPKGVSVSNVPDMPDPGPGAETFFYTNQQSARLMFYHDHAWGITRLNVYAGEAAAYLLTDPMEQSLIAPDGCARRSRHRNAARRPGQDLRPGRGHDGQGRPDLGRRQVGRRGQPVDAARLHARAEPERPIRHERVRTLDVRPVVLAAGEGRQVPADRQPVLRPDL